MGSLRFSDYCDSPTVLLPPQPIHAFSPASYSLPAQHQQTYPSSLPSKPQSLYQSNQVISSVPATANPSRKRTRDESLEESPAALIGTLRKASSVCQVACESSEEDNSSIPTDNMDLTGAVTGDTIPTGNQFKARFGKQADTEIEAAAHAAMPQAGDQRGTLAEPSRKVRRRDRSPSRESMSGNSSNSDGSTKSCPEHPPIDESTYLLGIGWALISEDRDVQAAARGYAKYIENHYPLSTAKVIMKSKGLDAILVETNEGYHLFNEDLTEGKLVSVTRQNCLANLQRSPVVFEGLTTLKTAGKNRSPIPKPDCEDKPGVDANLSNSMTDFEMALD